ncbi:MULTISPECIES: hypothetical protein [Paenibacillus]|uniref:hypothetical protein n=1 Tax=Paenibacillus TaxID=44249 RepID=UPI0010F899F8|nr:MULTISPECIES: hypothetical protein [Paenibacillus]
MRQRSFKIGEAARMKDRYSFGTPASASSTEQIAEETPVLYHLSNSVGNSEINPQACEHSMEVDSPMPETATPIKKLDPARPSASRSILRPKKAIPAPK